MFDAGNAYEFPNASFNNPLDPPSSEPSDTPLTTVCLNTDWLPFVLGALDQLCLPSTWNGDVDDVRLAIARAMTLKSQFTTSACPVPDVETPYWDDATDVEDDEPADMQSWYGVVEDVLAPPDGITWNENIALWLATGLVAITATPAAAIAFRPLAVQFAVAFKAGDVGETIRVIMDSIDQGTIDTSGHAGEIMEMAVSGDTTLSEHQLYVIKAS